MLAADAPFGYSRKYVMGRAFAPVAPAPNRVLDSHLLSVPNENCPCWLPDETQRRAG